MLFPFNTAVDDERKLGEYWYIIAAGLVFYDNDHGEVLATLVGIHSWSGACGYAEYPGVFGRVTVALEWIE